MKPEEQRIAIARACGIDIEQYRMEDGGINVWPIPNYLNDLNAMHEAIRSLSNSQLQQYGKGLCWVCGIDMNERAFLAPEVFLATSEQCAEAFLRTLNLWTDDT